MVTKSVVILDHRSHMLAPTDQTVVIDDLKASKSKWTVLMEAAVEYTRIILDVCFTNHQVLVVVADETLTMLNSWDDQVGITEMVNQIGVIGPPKPDENEEEADMNSALTDSIDLGLTNSMLDVREQLMGREPSHRMRLVCFTSIADPKDIIETVTTYLKSEKSDCDHKVEVVVFNMVDHLLTGKEDTLRGPNYEIHNAKPGNMFSTVLNTCLDVHNLTITTITSIPMKEELGNNPQAAAYNVDIVHPVVNLPCCPKERLTMKWCSPKCAQNIVHSNCIATYPVTPLDVSERPTICLVNFLLVGKQVILEYPSPNLSVVLVNHGNTITMHYIANSTRSIFDSLVPITDVLGGKVTNYRTEEMINQVLSNLTLGPHPQPNTLDISKSDLPVMRSLLNLERRLAVFPIVYSASVLHSCGLSHIFSLLSKDELTDREVTECQQVIYRVQGIDVKKEPITMKTRGSRKEDPIQELWLELEKLIVSMSDISPQHSKVKDCLYKIRKPTISEAEVYQSLKGESDKKKGEKTQAVLTAATSRKRDIETMELDTSTSVIKSHKTVHSSHPTLAGEKVALINILPKAVCKEFPGRLNGVIGPDQLYANFQQKMLHTISSVKKVGSPYNSPKHSPRQYTRDKSASRPD